MVYGLAILALGLLVRKVYCRYLCRVPQEYCPRTERAKQNTLDCGAESHAPQTHFPLKSNDLSRGKPILFGLVPATGESRFPIEPSIALEVLRVCFQGLEMGGLLPG